MVHHSSIIKSLSKKSVAGPTQAFLTKNKPPVFICKTLALVIVVIELMHKPKSMKVDMPFNKETKPNQTHEGWYTIKQRNQTKPNQIETHEGWYSITQRNQTKPNRTKPKLMKIDIPLNKETKPNQTKSKPMKVDILLHKETKPNTTELSQNSWRLIYH